MGEVEFSGLWMTGEQVAALTQIVISGMPYEVCGFLAGAGGKVREILPVRNVSVNRSKEFRMEGQGQLSALLEIDRLGSDLLAIYHSHPPGTRTDPSPNDLAGANYPDALMLIAVPKMDKLAIEMRAFAVTGETFIECPIHIESNP